MKTTTVTLAELLLSLAKKQGSGHTAEFTFSACPSVSALIADTRLIDVEFYTPEGLGELVTEYLTSDQTLIEPPDIDRMPIEEIEIRVPVFCFYGIDKTTPAGKQTLSRKINAAFHAMALADEERDKSHPCPSRERD